MGSSQIPRYLPPAPYPSRFTMCSTARRWPLTGLLLLASSGLPSSENPEMPRIGRVQVRGRGREEGGENAFLKRPV